MIERLLILIRNILHIPTDPEAEQVIRNVISQRFINVTGLCFPFSSHVYISNASYMERLI